MFYNFLFPQTFRGKGVSFLILCIRLFFGVLFFMHGLDKTYIIRRKAYIIAKQRHSDEVVTRERT